MLPGFIDAHVHFPQYRMLAAPGKDLLDWLYRFTFPEERRYASPPHARAAAEAFLDRLVQHGTTAAVVFSTVHRSATETLFAAAERRGQAIVSGKTLMDRNAPAGAVRRPRIGHARQRGADRALAPPRPALRYAITVRFAATSTEEQLREAGALAARHPDCHVHSHLSESEGEIDLVRRLFPWAKDYTDVYDRFGLLGPRSLYAHGIHLSERECARLSETGAVVVHCPTSNTFLGSGLFDAAHVGRADRPVRIGIATDVGGGTSYSMLHTLGEAYKVAILRGRTPGRARAVPLRDPRQRGEPGPRRGESGLWNRAGGRTWVVLDPTATPVLEARHALSENIEDTLFALAILGDDRAVRATYIAGRRAWGAFRPRAQ